MSDLVLFDLIVFNESWGRWGVGPVMLFPTATNDALGAEKWAIGPAAGFVARSQKLLWGVFNQNLFSFAGNNDREDVNVSIIQPIINYSLPDQWSIGTSEMNITYDWEKDDWTACRWESNWPSWLNSASCRCSSRVPASTTLQKTMWRPSGP